MDTEAPWPASTVKMVLGKKRDRFRILAATYELAQGESDRRVNLGDVVTKSGLPQADVEAAIPEMQRGQLLRFDSGNAGRFVSLTREGLHAIEGAVVHPDQPGRDFPALTLIFGDVERSMVQVMSPGSTQTVAVSVLNKELLSELSGMLSRLAGSPSVPAEVRDGLRADAVALDAQARAKSPDERGILKTLVGALARLARCVGDSAVGEFVSKCLALLWP